MPSGAKWSVRSTGAQRSSATFDTRKEAVKTAQKIAQNHKTELYIHGRDGRIRERHSYRDDPFPSKD